MTDFTELSRVQPARLYSGNGYDKDGYINYADAEPGDTVFAGYSTVENATPDDATFVILDMTSWGDYSGSTIERSNYRRLLEEYRETFAEVRYDFDGHALALPVAWPSGAWAQEHLPSGLGENAEDARKQLFETLSGLESDYPVYDDEDLSSLENDLVGEMWDCWVRSDLVSELYKVCDADAVDDVSEDQLRELFYSFVGESPEPFHAEDAVSVVFPYFPDAVAHIAAMINDGTLPRPLESESALPAAGSN